MNIGNESSQFHCSFQCTYSKAQTSNMKSDNGTVTFDEAEQGFEQIGSFLWSLLSK